MGIMTGSAEDGVGTKLVAEIYDRVYLTDFIDPVETRDCSSVFVTLSDRTYFSQVYLWKDDSIVDHMSDETCEDVMKLVPLSDPSAIR